MLQLVHEHTARAPDIDLGVVVAIVEEDLGRSIAHGDFVVRIGDAAVLLREFASQSEVADLHLSILVDEDVGVYPSTSLLSRTLDVSVKHLLLVQVGESFKHLVHEALHFLHREEHFLLQQLEEIVLRLPMKDTSCHPCKDMNSITMYNSG